MGYMISVPYHVNFEQMYLPAKKKNIRATVNMDSEPKKRINIALERLLVEIRALFLFNCIANPPYCFNKLRLS
jgi:hypothetical protein